MNVNSKQKTVALVSLIALLGLGLFPPWQQAAEGELAYRKDLGRAFLLRPPATVAVDCYFAGCTQAPASYFHVLLNKELVAWQLVSVSVVALFILWMFRTRRDGTSASLSDKKTRLGFSLLMALLVPPTGTFPFATTMLGIPKELVRRDEFWLIQMIIVVLGFVLAAFIVYLLVSALLRLLRVRGSQTQSAS